MSRLTRQLILCLAMFSVAIPAVTLAAATQRSDFSPDQRATSYGGCPEKAGVGSSTTPASPERRPRTVRDRWKSPHRNLSTSN
jgi:hypothetical protein